MTDTVSIKDIVGKLSEAVKTDIRDGNCLMFGDHCLCGSTSHVKEEALEHRLARFKDFGALGLNDLGLAVRSHLIGEA